MGLPEDDNDVQTVYLATYKKFMEAIDAIDNGNFCSACSTSIPTTRTVLLLLILSHNEPNEAKHRHVLFPYMYLALSFMVGQ